MSKKQKNAVRVPLVDWQAFWLTLGLVFILAAAMAGLYFMGWDDGMLGSIISLFIALIFCTLVLDLGYILSACITIGEGGVNAGKDEQGQQMIFHASSVTRIEMRDKADKVLPDDASLYKDARIVFVMESGRVNRRKVSRLTAGQYARIKAALEAEKKCHTKQ